MSQIKIKELAPLKNIFSSSQLIELLQKRFPQFYKLLSYLIIYNNSMALFRFAVIFINILIIHSAISCQDQHCTYCNSYVKNNITYEQCTHCQYSWYVGNTSCFRAPTCSASFCVECDLNKKYCTKCNQYYTVGIANCQLKPYMVGIISAICGLIVIVISIFLIQHYCKRIRLGDDQSNQQGNQRNINIENSNFRLHDAQINIHNGNHQSEKIKKRWKELIKVVYKLQSNQFFPQTNTCAICLSDRCNTITQCNHQFHFLCLVFWIQKQNKCPLCKKQLDDEVKLITCENCRDQYELYDLNKPSDEDLKTYKMQNRKLLCPECKDKKNLKRVDNNCQSKDEKESIK